MIADNLLSVTHAVVADLDGAAIEDFSKLVVFREVFVTKGKESVPDVGVGLLNGGFYLREYRFVVYIFVWKLQMARTVDCSYIRSRRVLFSMEGRLGRMVLCPMKGMMKSDEGGHIL